MAISVDWPTKVITVNQTDPEVTLVSGTTYELDTDAFRLALKDLEDSEAGMVWERITQHNTTYEIDGITYVRAFAIINGYTVQALPDAMWRLRMDGASNNNFHSEGVLINNTVQVIPANSAGNTIVETGVSGLTAQEAADLATAAAQSTTAATEATLTRKLVDADRVLSDGATGNMEWIDADDGVTILRTKNVKSKTQGAITIPDDAPAEERRQ